MTSSASDDAPPTARTAAARDPAETGWHEVGDRVFRRRFAFCDVTSTVVIGADGAAVIDTRSSPAEARELKEQIPALTAAPVRWVVNTHAHFDHSWGNAEFSAPRLDPPAQLWAQANACAARLYELGTPESRELLAYLEEGDPAWYAANSTDLTLVAPDHPVDWAARLDLGGRSLDLRYFGRGHTDGDLWIGVPDAGVVLAGDLVEQSAPPAFGPDSFPLEWADTLDRALSWIAGIGGGTSGGDTTAHAEARPAQPQPVTIVPGHGEPVDAAFVARQRDHVDAVAREITRLHAAGVPVERAAAEGEWPQPSPSLRDAIARGYAELSQHGLG